MNNLEDYIWAEKYRPKTLDDIILSPATRSKIQEFKTKENIPHLLFVGTAGIGKTSLARILVNDVLDCDYIEINASEESGVDTIRSKVKSFATSASLDDKIKVVILGEADGLSKTAQNSLKEIIEDNSQTTRFIFTANNISKLSEPIVSRCQQIGLQQIDFKEFFARCLKIIQAEGIELNKEVLLKITRDNFPDFRKTINDLQINVVDGVQTFVQDKENSFAGKVFEELDKTGPSEVRLFCRKNVMEFQNHAHLMIDMAEYSFENLQDVLNRELILLLNKYLVQDSTHLDKELNFYCLLIELKKLL